MVLEHLNGIRGADRVRTADALVFRGAPEAPVRCAVELSRAIGVADDLAHYRHW